MMKKLLSVLLVFSLVVGSMGLVFADDDSAADYLLEPIVTTMADYISGEDAFDYVSYVYLGWRTTGGPWQNYVIEKFLTDRVVQGGYTWADQDMSSATDDDYAWLQYDSPSANSQYTWAPEYAKLEVVNVGGVEIDENFDDSAVLDLAEALNVESYAFDPTSKTYQDYYKDLYNLDGEGEEIIDAMYDWITAKDDNGTRINVFSTDEPGEEALLNQRVHLAWQTSFNYPRGTAPEEAETIRAEVINVGAISSSGGRYSSAWEQAGGDASQLEGKALYSTSSLSNLWYYANQVGAVSVMSKASMNAYNNPVIDGEQWYTNSARYSSGRGISSNRQNMEAGKPIVEWQLSLDQEAAILTMLEEYGTFEIEFVSIGDIYLMEGEEEHQKGQIMAIAEIAGSTKPEERVMFVAHVQEPSANDNATGVGLTLEIALKMKEMIDAGELERPERTMTFFWGDEMTCARFWLAAHPEEAQNVVAVIDLDMVGEDSSKTGGVMRIEKTPDPSAVYNYTLDILPGQDPYHETSSSFVRLPDSHTLWGAGSVGNLFKEGFFINDLYMEAAQTVIQFVDSNFQVDVCPYEGGSDHSVFLQSDIPALLTWHFTDYVYHTSVDTMFMVSVDELENVGITTLASGYKIANANEEDAKDLMEIVYQAVVQRFKDEKENTDRHLTWVQDGKQSMEAALANEVEVLQAWGDWYVEAIRSSAKYLLDDPSEEYEALEAEYITKVETLTESAISYARRILNEEEEPEINVVRYQADQGAIARSAGSTAAFDVTSTLSIENSDNINMVVMYFEYDANQLEYVTYQDLGDEMEVFNIIEEDGTGYLISSIKGGSRLTSEEKVELVRLQFRSLEGITPDEVVVKATGIEVWDGSDMVDFRVAEDTAITAVYYVSSVYDVNADGIVSWGDLAYAMDHYMKSAADYDDFYDGIDGLWRMDLDDDGVITMNDYLILMAGIEEALGLQFAMAFLSL